MVELIGSLLELTLQALELPPRIKDPQKGYDSPSAVHLDELRSRCLARTLRQYRISRLVRGDQGVSGRTWLGNHPFRQAELERVLAKSIDAEGEFPRLLSIQLSAIQR